LAKLESKVFLRIEALGESDKSRGYLLLLEEVWEKPRQADLSFSKAVAGLISVDLKKRKRVKDLVTFRVFQLIFLICSP
jgi:hypothetical protein